MIEDSLPQRVRGVDLYDPKRPNVDFDLSDNTNQWPLAPRVIEILSSDNIAITRYPDIYASTLKEKLADLYSLNVRNIVVGCGTDDVLDSTIRALTDVNDIIASPKPSFPMVKYFGEFNQRKIAEFEINDDGSINIETIDRDAKLIYLCTPNNPTGQIIPKENIEKLIEVTNAFIIIDEAYAEFAEEDCLSSLENEKVIITRTFSKIYGLAGLRIGYALGNEKAIAAIEALRGPYKANTIGIKAAITSIESREYYLSLLEEVKQTRDFFIGGLIGLGLTPQLSHANFVFVPGSFSSDLKEQLSKRGFSLRQFLPGDIYGVEGIRITLAPKPVLEKFLEALKELI